MLVEPDAVITQPVELLPRLEMFGIGPRRDLGLEIFVRQRIGQLVADLQMIELFTISQEIEYEDFHRIAPHPPASRAPPSPRKRGKGLPPPPSPRLRGEGGGEGLFAGGTLEARKRRFNLIRDCSIV